MSVRFRIAVTIAVLTALAMATAGVLVYALESAQIEHDIDQQISQEIGEFRRLEQGDDPQTGRPFTSARALLGLYLQRNVTDDDEMLVTYLGDRQVSHTPNQFGTAVLSEQGYEKAVADLAGTGGTVEYQSPRYEEVWVTVVPVRTEVRAGAPDGALVIVNFLDDERSELDRTIRTYALVALVSLAVIVLLAFWQSGRLLAPLTTLRDTAREITGTDLSRRIPARGRDDITALTHTINDMLERLESAFADQRNFLDDAGHELRTPLTVLRGHLELLAQDDPDDVARTRDLLLDEVDRMSRLVDDLVVLAKARRPDFLSPRPVELGKFTHGLLAKARALGERRWRLDGTGGGVTTIDQQRITQAVLQLADNAVKHTDDDDEIAIGSADDDGTVRIWVRDTGDGVPEEDRRHIFERFGRSAVRPGDEGFGLGLSIVEAIALAHGGTVRVTDAPGGGARFEIAVPTRKEASQTWPGS